VEQDMPETSIADREQLAVAVLPTTRTPVPALPLEEITSTQAKTVLYTGMTVRTETGLRTVEADGNPQIGHKPIWSSSSGRDLPDRLARRTLAGR